MNEDQEMTTAALHLATSRTLPPGTALDPSTAAAREAFLSLGSALASAGGALDEQALVARLQRECLREEKAAHCVVVRRGRRSWSLPLVHGILAVAVLALLGWFAGSLWPARAPLNQPLVAQSPAGDSARSAASSLRENVSDAYAAALPGSGWSDPLDDQIAYVAATIGELSSPNRGVDGSLWEASDRLEALSREMFSESL